MSNKAMQQMGKITETHTVHGSCPCFLVGDTYLVYHLTLLPVFHGDFSDSNQILHG